MCRLIVVGPKIAAEKKNVELPRSIKDERDMS
jgi:hypothetical protein